MPALQRDFSRFYKKGKNQSQKHDFKTYTLEQMEELGLTLKNGIKDLPEDMQRRLANTGVTELFPVQTSAFTLFVKEQNELIVK